MATKRKTTRKTKTPKLKGVARQAGKRAGASALGERKRGAVSPGFTLRAEPTLFDMGV